MSGVNISIDFGARLGASQMDFGSRWAQVYDLLESIRFRWQEDLLELWPVDTGTSLQAWENYVSGLVWVLRNPVEYAEWVHVEGDDTPLVDYLEAKAEEYAAEVEPSLSALLQQARQESAPFGQQAPLVVGAGPATATLRQRALDALFASTMQAFEVPGMGARQRLRARFPDQPIGRAFTRRRDRLR